MSVWIVFWEQNCSRNWMYKTSFIKFISNKTMNERRRFNVASSTFNIMLSFELINASTSFQIYINKILHEYLNIFTFAYMNDTFIYTKEDREYFIEEKLFQEHIEHVKLILQKFRKHELYVKFSKCVFYTIEVDFWAFLSHVRT